MSVLNRRPSTVVALFVLAVGLILASVPGWLLCYACWVVFAWAVLLVGGLRLAWRATAMAWRRPGQSAGAEWAQVLRLAVAAGLLWPMHRLSHAVYLVGQYRDLKAEAMALPADGGPRFAWNETDENGYGHDGFAYDPSGQIVRPRALRSAAWQRRVAGTLFATDCWGAERIVGAFYRWDGNGCV